MNNNIPQDEFEIIENYILNKLNEEELMAFENKLARDVNLKKKVEEFRSLIESIEISALKEKMDEFHDEDFSNTISLTHKKNTNWYKKIAIAASIALLIGLGGFGIFNTKNSNQKLYSKYFKPDPGLPTVMSTTNEYDFYDAMVNYKRGEYDLAIKKWEVILTTKPQNDTINYFLGAAYLAANNEQKAIKHLKIVTNNTRSNFNKDAFYYKGLAYLKTGNIELSKESLILSNSEKGKKIISELKE